MLPPCQRKMATNSSTIPTAMIAIATRVSIWPSVFTAALRTPPGKVPPVNVKFELMVNVRVPLNPGKPVNVVPVKVAPLCPRLSRARGSAYTRMPMAAMIRTALRTSNLLLKFD